MSKAEKLPVEHLPESSFRDLDGNTNLLEPLSAIDVWYATVRDTKLVNLTDGDLARACRQNIYVEAIAPFCLRKLENDPLAGDMDFGELIRAMKSFPPSYWREHPDIMEKYLQLAEKAYLDYLDYEGLPDWAYDQLHITKEDLLN